MSGWEAPQLAVPLSDGSRLLIGSGGVQAGEQLYPLTTIHDARLVSPQPETIALRLAGEGLVELQPARPGDAALALEAIYRLRPDLRPAGFEPVPSLPPTFPPPLPSPVAPPQGYYLAPGILPSGVGSMPYARNPNDFQPELTPVPRSFGQLLSAVFQLYFKHFRKWLLLALCVGIWPGLLVGTSIMVSLALAGLNPWGSYLDFVRLPSLNGTSGPTSTPTPTPPIQLQFPTGQAELVLLGILAGSVLLLLFFAPWQIATLSLAARAAVIGHPLKIGAALGGGLRRLPAVLGVYLLEMLLIILLSSVVSGAALLVFFGLGVALAANGSSSSSTATAAVAVVTVLIALVCVVLFYIGAIYFSVRLALAPYAAATERIGPAGAIRKSWRLTRGNFWRTLGVLFIVGFVTGALGNVVSAVDVVSIPAAALVALPLVLAITTPLSALAAVVVLVDLRLRQEGYPVAATGDGGSIPRQP